MLKAFINVTADKTHFSIDIKNLIILVYLSIFHYNSSEYNITSFATSFSCSTAYIFYNTSTAPIIKPILPFYNYCLLIAMYSRRLTTPITDFTKTDCHNNF